MPRRSFLSRANWINTGGINYTTHLFEIELCNLEAVPAGLPYFFTEIHLLFIIIILSVASIQNCLWVVSKTIDLGEQIWCSLNLFIPSLCYLRYFPIKNCNGFIFIVASHFKLLYSCLL